MDDQLRPRDIAAAYDVAWSDEERALLAESAAWRARLSQRARDLLQIALADVLALRAGAVHHFSTSTDLGVRCGYHPASARRLLRQAGIAPIRCAAIKEYVPNVEPSPEYAWLLGVLSTGGSCDLARPSIALTSYDVALVDEVRRVGERLFGVSARITTLRTASDGRPYYQVRFSTKPMARAIGSLRRTAWPAVLRERHPWLTTTSRYLWPFIAGVIDTSGSVRAERRERGILLRTHALSEAAYLLDCLIRLGLARPKVKLDRTRREGIRGVAIVVRHDLWEIARHVRLCVPALENKLALFRGPEPALPPVPASDCAVVEEWARLAALLGHPPASTDITRLHHAGQTPYSMSVYRSRFGHCPGGENARRLFSVARVRLERQRVCSVARCG